MYEPVVKIILKFAPQMLRKEDSFEDSAATSPEFEYLQSRFLQNKSGGHQKEEKPKKKPLIQILN